MDLDKIPYETLKSGYIIKDNEHTIDFINNLKVSNVIFTNVNIINYDINIEKCIIDNKYITGNNYYFKYYNKYLSEHVDYFEGNNTIGIFYYKSEHDNIINQKHINTLKIYINYNNYDKSIKLINNLPENIENLIIICYSNYLKYILNLPITLKYIRIHIDLSCNDLQEIMNIKIPFNCSLNYVFINRQNNDSIVYKDLQKYK